MGREEQIKRLKLKLDVRDYVRNAMEMYILTRNPKIYDEVWEMVKEDVVAECSKAEGDWERRRCVHDLLSRKYVVDIVDMVRDVARA